MGKKCVAYYRVSTGKQGASGLGLEAQQRDCRNWADRNNATIESEFTEVESGKKNDRPKLLAALAYAKSNGMTLVISKLDRLGRNASFLMSLRDSGVDFVCCDMPEANTLTIGFMAIMAQNEREMISSRTKKALESLKERGVKLGKPDNFSDTGREKGNSASSNAIRLHYAPYIEMARALRSQGVNQRDICRKMYEAGMVGKKGGQLSLGWVNKVLKQA